MIKALATGKDGRPILILGLSRGNMERLLDGKPIQVDPADLKIPGGPVVIILGGETEEAIQAELAKHVKLPPPQPDPTPQRPWDDCPACLYGDCFNPAHQ
jgi:hypothetical protein